MTDEEKKAIEMLRNYDNEDNLHKIHQSINVVLNLIEKQSKEIEELKDKYSDEKIRNTIIKRYREVIEKDYVSKDKIKAIIEELQEDIKYSANPLSIDNSKFAIIVLRSLLRKEFPVTITKEELEKRWKG